MLTSLRTLIRLDNWWHSKMPPLLAAAYLAILIGNVAPLRALVLLFSLVVSLSCVAAYGHIINDIFDVAADRKAGKPNAMGSVG